MLVTKGEATVIDVALVEHPYGKAQPTAQRPLDYFEAAERLFEDVSLGPLSHELEEAVLDACAPAHENFHPVRQFGCPYGLVREVASDAARGGPNYDPDGKLFQCMALSRLVHPNSLSEPYSARIKIWENGARQIVAHSRHTWPMWAFVAHEELNWLNPSDAPAIGQLVAAFRAAPRPKRLTAALWYLEYAFRSYYVDIRWPLLATAVESLVHIDGEMHPTKPKLFAGSTKVFVDRLLGIGQLDPALALNEAQLRTLYAHRSKLTHGQPIAKLPAAAKQDYDLFEGLVRGITRKALIDPAFQSIFASDAALQTALPLR